MFDINLIFAICFLILGIISLTLDHVLDFFRPQTETPLSKVAIRVVLGLFCILMAVYFGAVV